MSLSDHESDCAPTCSLCGQPMPPGEEMFKFHGYSGPCPSPASARLREESDAARSAFEDANSELARERRENDRLTAENADLRVRLSGALFLAQKATAQAAERTQMIAALSAPVEPAGASEPPMEREDVGQHQHEFAEVEVCRHCLRTEADIEGTCHHCDEGTGARCWWCLKLKSASAQASDPPKTWIPTEGCSCYLCRAARLSPTPVSPVAPEPPTDPACKRCGHTLSAHRPEFGACDGSTRPCACPEFVQTTGAPAPCVWREDGPTMATGCGVRNSMLPRNPIKQGWKACPYCKAPLNE